MNIPKAKKGINVSLFANPLSLCNIFFREFQSSVRLRKILVPSITEATRKAKRDACPSSVDNRLLDITSRFLMRNGAKKAAGRLLGLDCRLLGVRESPLMRNHDLVCGVCGQVLVVGGTVALRSFERRAGCES